MSNTEWDGEGLPPVGTECEIRIGGDYYKFTILAVHKEHVWASRTDTSIDLIPATFSIDRLRPLPKLKKIDIAKFAGSEFLMSSDDGYVIATENSELLLTNRQKWEPAFNHWNHWTGDSKPDWLEGLEYEVKTVYPDGSQCGVDFEITRSPSSWSNVCAIKITGVKDGWEL